MFRRRIFGVVATAVTTLCTALPCRAEDASLADAPARYYVELDAAVLNVGLSGAGHLGARLYLGGGGSLLPAASVNTFAAYPIELAEAHGFLRWAPVPEAQVDVGVRGAYFQEFRICVFDPCSPKYGTFVGPYIDVRAGFRRVKLGPRFSFATAGDGVWGALFYPLVLRVQLS